MKKVHIVIPDLFLPQQLAAYACADLSLPALEKLLARGQRSALNVDTLEEWLCEQFGLKGMAIAPLTLQADGMAAGDGYWLRADPVGIVTQREQMILRADITLSDEEAAQLCASLNAHFADYGLRFVAPHPQRWYLQLDHVPEMHTHALAQVVGADMHAHLPYGADALRWHGVQNEIQMLFYEHAVNQARERRGEPVVNSVWLWGGGQFCASLQQSFSGVAGDSELARAFAQAAGLPVMPVSDRVPVQLDKWDGELLLVCESLRNALQRADIALWRKALLQFENIHLAPLLQSLASGQLDLITVDAISEGATCRYSLTRPALWKIWCFSKPLLHYALPQT